MKRIVSAIVGLLLGLALWWLLRSPPTSDSAPAKNSAAASGAAVSLADTDHASIALPINALNRPQSAIQDDLHLLHEVFAQWQTNFPATGNPIGTNAEITATLRGDNALQLDLIPRDHPAINARGELCDRWGTPFRFHQLSGREMEIISAGPDRDFATADDGKAP